LTYTISELNGIASTHLTTLKQKIAALTGAAPALGNKVFAFVLDSFHPDVFDDPEPLAREYAAKLARSNVSRAGRATTAWCL
jgi:hypothetical protein